MSNFNDLLNKSKAVDGAKAEEKAINPFAGLGKAIANAGVSGHSHSGIAAGEESTLSPKDGPPSSPANFSILGKKEPTSDVVAAESKPVARASLASKDETPPDDTMQGISGGSFSELSSAKEFQAEDQPDGYSEVHVHELKNSLQILTDSMGNKELVGDALKKIMMDLKRKPFLADILHPEDCNLMVMSLRENYGVTIAKKQARSTKRTQSQKEVEDVLGVLADVEINI